MSEDNIISRGELEDNVDSIDDQVAREKEIVNLRHLMFYKEKINKVFISISLIDSVRRKLNLRDIENFCVDKNKSKQLLLKS